MSSKAVSIGVLLVMLFFLSMVIGFVGSSDGTFSPIRNIRTMFFGATDVRLSGMNDWMQEKYNAVRLSEKRSKQASAGAHLYCGVFTDFTFTQATDALLHDGMRPANAGDLLAFAQSGEPFVDKRVVMALGERWVDPTYDTDYVPSYTDITVKMTGLKRHMRSIGGTWLLQPEYRKINKYECVLGMPQ